MSDDKISWRNGSNFIFKKRNIHTEEEQDDELEALSEFDLEGVESSERTKIAINSIDAYHEGVVAYWDGKNRNENPYKHDSHLRKEWSSGWMDTKQSDECPRQFRSIWDSIQNDMNSINAKHSAY